MQFELVRIVDVTTIRGNDSTNDDGDNDSARNVRNKSIPSGIIAYLFTHNERELRTEEEKQKYYLHYESHMNFIPKIHKSTKKNETKRN